MSPIRRDAEGNLQAGRGWESLADRQIREAQQRGAFEGLPYHGKPLPPSDDRSAGELAVAHSILRNHGVAPPWIEADKEARRLLQERQLILRRASVASPLLHRRYREELTRVIRAYDRAVAALNAEAPTDRQHRPRLDEANELEALELILTGPAPLSDSGDAAS